MTAIAGLWRFDGRPDAADGCTRMLAAQEIYGPDARGEWSEGGVALGRRLMRLRMGSGNGNAWDPTQSVNFRASTDAKLKK